MNIFHIFGLTAMLFLISYSSGKRQEGTEPGNMSAPTMPALPAWLLKVTRSASVL
ncbi:MAG: hypothetical protein Q8M08_12930 [Bacteroidales bacterium]|nr:hypothetical protein [Bacteroidales bacterium]